MIGGTLIVSRDIDNHSHYKKQLEQLGFRDVTVTGAEKDGLNMIINELKPRLVLMGSRFYEGATAYMMALLLKRYPKLNVAAVSLEKYPADLAIGMIVNGVTSYVNFFYGIDKFYAGLKLIKEGEKYISPVVEERMKTRIELPKPSQELTERQITVLRHICNGYTTSEISDVMQLCIRTVKFHTAELYSNLKIRNEKELIRVALYLGFIKNDELDFYGGRYELSPKQDKKKVKIRRVA